MAEFFSAMVSAMVAAAQLVAECLVFLAVNAFTAATWLCSRRYRSRKEIEWNGRKWTKRIELGFSSACLGILVALAFWFAWVVKRGRNDESVQEAGGENRLVLKVNGKESKTNFRLEFKDGGLKKIVGAENLKDLRRQIKENVTVTNDGTNSSGGRRIEIEFSHRAE